jgi:hypothetical protein
LLKDGEIPTTKFWGAADCRGYKRFETTAALGRWLRQQPPRVWLHHGNFDVLQLLCDGANISITKCHNGKLILSKWGSQSLLNSFALFPFSLARIFDFFGYSKRGLDDLDARNKDDCELGRECFLRLAEKFREVSDVNPLTRHTISGAAFHAAEQVAGTMPKDLRYRSAYRGGRVEVFDLRGGAASKYDINSTYPFSILDAPAVGVLLRVRVTTRDFYCPFFDAGNVDHLMFPNGTFETWVFEDTFERYIKPVMWNTRVKVLSRKRFSFAWFDRLKPFIRRVYQRKAESSGVEREACKLLLNSLYGRIGLSGRHEIAVIGDKVADGDEVFYYALRNGKFLSFRQVERPSRSNFPFAAYVTDNARARLFNSFARNEALYGDTDSVFVRSQDFHGQIGLDCGEFKYEGRDNFAPKSVKDYVFGEKESLKGGYGSTIWTLKRFASGQGAAEIERSRQTELQKRTVLPDGRTVPLIVYR